MKIVSHTTKNPEKRSYLTEGVKRISPDIEVVFIEPDDDPKVILRNTEVFLTYIFQQQWWESCNKLKWMHIGGAGVNHIAFPELVRSDVIVTNSRGIHARTMTEYTLAVMLYFAQSLHRAEVWKNHRDWVQSKLPMTRQSFTLRGKKVGIIGGGAIGTAIRDMCLKMEMGLFVIHRKRRSDTPWNVRNGDMGDLDALMQWSDYVIVTLPLTPETKNCIDRSRIGLMKESAVLINIARGGIVDEKALADALKNEKIAGAALDVFAEEPLPESSELFNAKNLLMTPHIAGNYPEYTIDIFNLFFDNLEKYLQNRPMKNIIDWARGY